MSLWALQMRQELLKRGNNQRSASWKYDVDLPSPYETKSNSNMPSMKSKSAGTGFRLVRNTCSLICHVFMHQGPSLPAAVDWYNLVMELPELS